MFNSTKGKQSGILRVLFKIFLLLNQTIKKAPLYVLWLVAISVNSTAQTDTWVQKSDFGYDAINVLALQSRTGAVGFSIGSKGYIGTGHDAAFSLLKDFWEYDTTANTWTQKADFGGTPRFDAVGFSIGNKGYIGTGSNGNDFKDFWQYDSDSNNWTQKADFGGTVRKRAIGFSINGKGYIGTGYSYGSIENYYKDFWEYDTTTDTWIQKGDFKGTPRSNAVGFGIGNKGYVGTGLAYNGTFYYYAKDFWEYDPATDNWTAKADFGGIARENATGISIGGKGYVGTGRSYDRIWYSYKDFWEYDPRANTWVQKADFSVTADDAVGFGIGSKGYMGTGTLYGTLGNYKGFWEYDSNIGTWTQTTDFGGSTARQFATGFSIDNKGYIGTGYDGKVKKDFWEYDPAKDIWTQKADFGGTGRYYAVGFSMGTKGYIGTGFDDNGYTRDFWEYDPGSNTWTKKANFGGSVRDAAVGFSIGGKGYLGTGFYSFYDWDGNYVSTFYKDFWEYNPLSDKWTQKQDFGGTARRGALGFGIGKKGYLGTGNFYDGTRYYYQDFWEYDPSVNTWTQKTDFGGAGRSDAFAFSINGKGYAGTGGNYLTYFEDFWKYDPITNTWTKKMPFSGGIRKNVVGFTIARKGYIGTGYAPEIGNTKDFWEYDPGTVLPITYTSFDAAKQGNSVLLNWQSFAEGNNAYFSVERSSTSNDFTAIGQVKNKGNTNTVQQYHFTDAHPFKGYNYYRLKQSDADGHLIYSKIVGVTFGSTAGYKLYPNPVKDILQLENLNGNETIMIVAQDGHVLDKKTISTKTYNWDVKSLSAGTYYLQITNGEKVTILKFIKE